MPTQSSGKKILQWVSDARPSPGADLRLHSNMCHLPLDFSISGERSRRQRTEVLCQEPEQPGQPRE